MSVAGRVEVRTTALAPDVGLVRDALEVALAQQGANDIRREPAALQFGVPLGALLSGQDPLVLTDRGRLSINARPHSVAVHYELSYRRAVVVMTALCALIAVFAPLPADGPWDRAAIGLAAWLLVVVGNAAIAVWRVRRFLGGTVRTGLTDGRRLTTR